MPQDQSPPGHVDALHPFHDAACLRRAPTVVVAEWPAGTFLENLAEDLADGSWLVTSPSDRAVYRVGLDGAVTVAATFDAIPTGIETHPTFGTLAAVGTQGQPDWHLHRISTEGSSKVSALPNVLSANGMAWIDDRLLVVDSGRNTIVSVDVDAGTAETWLEHELLTPATEGAPLPGVNGLAVHAGAVVISSSDRGLILRVPAGSSDPGGDLEVLAERLVGDDLAITADGRIFVATRTYHSVLCLYPDGRREDVADHADGVAGPTAVAVGGHPSTAVYVCTSGGLLSPPAGEVEQARLIRVDVLIEDAQ